ncbi:MAG: hypothetical protein IH801_07060, partial [Nitrospinae bacterium]|nr:hypothetical protein [Nitrospinota bacterium]
LDNYDSSLRSDIKKAFNIIINCCNRREATETIDGKIKNKKLSPKLISGKKLIDEFEQKHPLIKNKIASGEGVFGQFIDSQIAEKVILSLYGIIVALYLIRFSKTLLNTEYLLLLIAFGFFGFSIMIDLELVYFPGGTFAEDGTKLFGIANWCAYHTRACLKQIKLSTIVSAHLGQ